MTQDDVDLDALRSWAPPERFVRITTVDAHAEGEPLRIVTGGFPHPEGDSILARRRHALEHLDHLRKALMWEPRGHADMYGCLIVPPERPTSHFGVLFLHNEGYSTMCGHGIIAITTVAVQCGLVPAVEPETLVRIDTPVGLVEATARVADGRVESVSFLNVPSFVVALDQEVEVPGVGTVRYDLAFGGAYYAFVDAGSVGLVCDPAHAHGLIAKGMAIKRAVTELGPIRHPLEVDLGFLYGTIFVGPALGEGAHSRNVCVFADGEVDRSPTGTGVSARAAIHHARDELSVGKPVVIESIIGSRFTVEVASTTWFGSHRAVIPRVEGRAFVVGRHEHCIDPDDPLAHGFMIR